MVISDPLLTGNVIRRMLSSNFTVKMAYADYCHLVVMQSTYIVEAQNSVGNIHRCNSTKMTSERVWLGTHGLLL